MFSNYNNIRVSVFHLKFKLTKSLSTCYDDNVKEGADDATNGQVKPCLN